MNDKPRRPIIHRFKDFIIANRLATSSGSEVYQPDLRYYAVDFVGPSLVGSILVFSPRRILIRTHGTLAPRDRQVYATEQAAMDFLRLLVIERKPDEALAIPTKISKGS